MTKQQKTELRKSLGLKDSDFVMVYPAELNKNKNQEMLINAMVNITKTYKNVHLLLPGIDSLNGYHKALVNQKDVAWCVHFLGYRNDIPQLLNISDIAVSSSCREGLPVNIMEAMCAGRPVVATNCRGAVGLIDDGNTGYIVDINDTQQFVQKVLSLITDYKLCTKMGDYGRKISKGYTYAKIMPFMIDIYEAKL